MNLAVWWHRRRLRRQVAALDDAARSRILAAQPYDIAAFQGEGWHVFLKGEPDIAKAYVASLGEIGQRDAEDALLEWALGSPFAPDRRTPHEADAADARRPR